MANNKVFVVTSATPDSNGHIGPEEVRAAHRLDGKPVEVYLDSHFNVVYAASASGKELTPEQRAKAEYKVVVSSTIDDRTLIGELDVKGRDRTFSHHVPWYYSLNGASGTFNPIGMSVDKNGFVDFDEEGVKARLQAEAVKELNLHSDSVAAEAAKQPVPDRWKTGLQMPPTHVAAPEDVDHDAPLKITRIGADGIAEIEQGGRKGTVNTGVRYDHGDDSRSERRIDWQDASHEMVLASSVDRAVRRYRESHGIKVSEPSHPGEPKGDLQQWMDEAVGQEFKKRDKPSGEELATIIQRAMTAVQAEEEERKSKLDKLDARIAKQETELGIKPIPFEGDFGFDGRRDYGNGADGIRRQAIYRSPEGEHGRMEYLECRQNMIKLARKTGNAPTEREQLQYLIDHKDSSRDRQTTFDLIDDRGRAEQKAFLAGLERTQDELEGKKASPAAAKTSQRQQEKAKSGDEKTASSAVPAPTFGQLLMAFIGSMLGLNAETKSQTKPHEEHSSEPAGNMHQAKRQVEDQKIKRPEEMSVAHGTDYSNKSPASGPLSGQQSALTP